jgi:hypothetical protein
MTKFLTLAVGFVFLAHSQFANSADVRRGATPWDDPAIEIVGTIESGDYESIVALAKAFLKDGNEVQLKLNSPGGDFIEALRIGEFVKAMNARTMVVGVSSRSMDAEKTKCFSACFIIFVSGSVRDYRADNVVWDKSGNYELNITPVIGIHRPYFSPEEFAQQSAGEAREKYREIERLTRGYLEEVGISQSIIDEMFAASSQEVRLIGEKEYRERIGYKQAFFEEWLISRCGVLSASELEDWATVAAQRIFRNEPNLVPKKYSAGYVNYLEKRKNEIQSCRDRTVLLHQKTAIQAF